MAQKRKMKQTAKRPQEEAQETAQGARNEELAQETDAVLEAVEEALGGRDDAELLDAIDDILERNAEEFVNNYVQEGGE